MADETNQSPPTQKPTTPQHLTNALPGDTVLYMKGKREREFTELTAVRLDPQQVRALEKIGQEEDRSVSWLIRRAIDEFLKRAQSGKRR